MLCFVQTDAVVEDPDAALRAAVDASFERITVDGQMSTNDTVAPAGDRRGRARRCPRACSRPSCCSSRSRSSPTARARPGRPGPGRRRRRVPRRPSGSRGRSPTRRWSRRRSSAATPTGAGSPRRPGMALAGEDLEELGAERDRRRRARARRRRGGARPAARPRRARRPRLVLRPQLRVRADQRGVHDMSERSMTEQAPQSRAAGSASRRCSRRCPTSASSTAARW